MEMTRSLGNVTLIPFGLSSQPTIQKIPLKEAHCIVIASDGLTHQLHRLDESPFYIHEKSNSPFINQISIRNSVMKRILEEHKKNAANSLAQLLLSNVVEAERRFHNHKPRSNNQEVHVLLDEEFKHQSPNNPNCTHLLDNTSIISLTRK